MQNWTLNLRAITASLLLLVGSVAFADRVIPLEQGRETQSSDIVLPSSNVGSLVFKSCSGCKLNSLRLTPNTQFMIGAAPVSLRDVELFFRAGGPYFVMVYHDVKEPIVTRIVVHAKLPQQRRK